MALAGYVNERPILGCRVRALNDRLWVVGAASGEALRYPSADSSKQSTPMACNVLMGWAVPLCLSQHRDRNRVQRTLRAGSRP